jgi:hypothetical protein
MIVVPPWVSRVPRKEHRERAQSGYHSRKAKDLEDKVERAKDDRQTRGRPESLVFMGCVQVLGKAVEVPLYSSSLNPP